MALNTNIALGVQPIQQQPNMLAQYAQVMAIKAAQQEMEGNEGIRGALSQGVPDDPTKLLQYGKQGRATYETLLKGKKEQIDSAAKTLTMAGQIAGYVRDNPTPENFVSAIGTMVQNGVLTRTQAERVIADAGNDPTKIKSYAERTVSDALTEADRLTARTRIQAANIGAGPGYQRNQLERERFNLEQADSTAISNILGGSPTAPAAATTPPMMGGGGGVVPTTSVSPAPMGAAPAGVVGQPNVLATQVAPPPAPSVNALDPNAQKPNTLDQISALIRIGKPKAIQAADALIKQYNLENPEGAIEQDASGALVTVNRRTNVATPVLGKDGKPIMGKSQFESAYNKGVGEEAAKSDVAIVNSAQAAVAKLQDINQTLTQLNKSDAITGFGADLLKDVERFRAQFTKDTKAGKRVADTEVLNAMLGSEVFGMIQSLGVGARGLDTPAEREYLREVMTGTIKMDKAALVKLTQIRKNVTERAIDEYNKKLDRGELDRYFSTRGIKPQKIEKPSAASTGDISVEPAIQSLLDKYK